MAVCSRRFQISLIETEAVVADHQSIQETLFLKLIANQNRDMQEENMSHEILHSNIANIPVEISRVVTDHHPDHVNILAEISHVATGHRQEIAKKKFLSMEACIEKQKRAQVAKISTDITQMNRYQNSQMFKLRGMDFLKSTKS